MVGAKQPVQWFLGGRVVVIQQGTNVWVGLPSQEKQLYVVANEMAEFEK